MFRRFNKPKVTSNEAKVATNYKTVNLNAKDSSHYLT